MQSGVVKWFDPTKGYGFIAGDNGVDVFVHQSNVLMQGYRVLNTGQRVRYKVESTEKGNSAVNVTME